MANYLIRQAKVVNESSIRTSDVLIKDGKIEQLGKQLDLPEGFQEIDGKGKHLLPGIIDDQVHFREPGLTNKGTIASESRAAVAGGVTSYMEMPNTKPPALTQEALEVKYKIASETSLANYSFYMGTDNDNLDEVVKTDPKNVCGVKIFMGSSTGNMLVEDEKVLDDLFSKSPVIIVTHCEDEATIKINMERIKEKYGDFIPPAAHMEIRDELACLKSTKFAIDLAQKHNTRLHILHMSTGEEMELLSDDRDLNKKRITAEVCVHHLWYDGTHYAGRGNLIKCNPSIKTARHRKSLWVGLNEGKLDVIATDHAPHTWEEKQGKYIDAPAGLPLVQHGLNMMLSHYHEGRIALEKIVEMMCHNPAVLFNIEQRGYVREGYFADLALVDLNKEWIVGKENIQYLCNWSPLDGQPFKGAITHTFVNGHLVYEDGQFNDEQKGMRLSFDR